MSFILRFLTIVGLVFFISCEEEVEVNCVDEQLKFTTAFENNGGLEPQNTLECDSIKMAAQSYIDIGTCTVVDSNVFYFSDLDCSCFIVQQEYELVFNSLQIPTYPVDLNECSSMKVVENQLLANDCSFTGDADYQNADCSYFMRYIRWDDADNVIYDEFFGTEDMIWTMFYIPSSEPSDDYYSAGNTEVDYILYDGVSNYFQYSINGQLETYQITDNMVNLSFSPIN